MNQPATNNGDVLVDDSEVAVVPPLEFFGKDWDIESAGSREFMEHAIVVMEGVERHGTDVQINLSTSNVVIEPKFPGTWKDVATKVFRSQQSSGLASTFDSLDSRCETMETWKECAMDLLGYTEFW